ncbi:hypothetical protein DV495_002191 [Geotrichum candidum]|uniref:Acireductone dioxygenase n=1 Tax=Geotrichum candidum TaxID=1173061 RepID=A0A0J9X760_GEOCN|nr:hypothetical protein DV452_000632 [Geotrichum candidum]KAI9211492.1 hypothetical protein DS838_003637 [Geotrichum bryndzae]KAF5129491.1 hypothetical protein DV495_002191 [Geotrichum candidum]KAF7497386.1 hypothetical protein DV113_004585 [Geotrichum candidum]KAI8131788.1 hypothetical protein DUD61_004550 [Geotrichum candidum]
MKTYYHDNRDDVDQREPHFGGEELTPDQLKDIGVLYYHCNDIDSVDKIAEERNYVSRDVIQITPEKLGGPEAYAEKLRTFYAEHLHEDEEIRYILEGEGYFDVREKNDRWVRCALETGDLLILPAGIYHRFTLTSKDYVKALRLFKEQPRWVAINRPIADDNPYRSEYLTSIAAN